MNYIKIVLLLLFTIQTLLATTDSKKLQNSFNITEGVITFFIDTPTKIDISVHTFSGQEVAIYRGYFLKAGLHMIPLVEGALANGTYIVTLQSQSCWLSQKVTLAR